MYVDEADEADETDEADEAYGVDGVFIGNWKIFNGKRQFIENGEINQFTLI